MADLTASADDTLGVTDAASSADRIVVNGLDMSIPTWDRVIAALRGLHPEIPANLSDGALIQQVMKYMVTEWVASWEARQATPEPTVVAQQALQQALDTRAAAGNAARSDLGTDIHFTITT